jgi:hypothetical protein
MPDSIPTPATLWVSEFLDRNQAMMDHLIHLLGHIRSSAIVEGYGQWDEAYVTEELWRQIRLRVSGSK